MNHKKYKRGKILLEIFDVLFIMLLCFGTLLAAMIIEKNKTSTINYSVDFTILTVTIGVMILYLCFILLQSDKGLRIMIYKLYEQENTKETNN